MARRKKNRRNMTRIYGEITQIKARKGKKSLWPGEAFQHDFEEGAEVLGIGETGQYKLKKGDLVIRSRKGKRLWKNFDY